MSDPKKASKFNDKSKTSDEGGGDGKQATQKPARETSPSDGDTTCGSCDQVDCTIQINQTRSNRGVTNQKVSTRWIKCDKCLLWYHGLCQQLRDGDIHTIGRLEVAGLRWLCDTCVEIEVEMTASPLDSNDSPQLAITKLITIEQTVKKIDQSYSDVL